MPGQQEIQVQQVQQDKDPLVQVGLLVLPGSQDPLVFLEQQSTQALLEPLAPQVPLDLQVPQVSKVPLDQAVARLDHKVRLVQQVQEPLVPLALQAIPAL